MVEDEFNILRICPFYKSERGSFLKYGYQAFPNFNQLNLQEQFVWLLRQEDETCTVKLASLVNRCMELRGNELDKLTVTESTRSGPPLAARRKKCCKKVMLFQVFFIFNDLLSSVCSKALDI